MIAFSPLVVLRAKAWCGAVRRSKASPIPWLQYVIVAVLQNVSPRPPTDRPAAVRRCLEDSGNKGWFGKPRADAKTERPPRGPLPRACMSLTCARLTTCAPGPGRCPQRKPPTPRTRRQSRAWRVVNYCCSSPPPPSAAAFVRRRVRGKRRSTSTRTRLCDIQARCQCKTAFACMNESIINRGYASWPVAAGQVPPRKGLASMVAPVVVAVGQRAYRRRATETGRSNREDAYCTLDARSAAGGAEFAHARAPASVGNGCFHRGLVQLHIIQCATQLRTPESCQYEYAHN